MTSRTAAAAPGNALVGALDALPDHIAIIDESGLVVDSNAAWRAYARENGYPDDRFGIGENYLRVCDAAAAAGDPHAREVGQGLRDVLADRRRVFTYDYPCPSPDEEVWFQLRAARFTDGDAPLVVVAHTLITERVRAERALQLGLERYRLAALAANDVIFDWDVGTDVVYWAPGVEHVFGHADVPARARIDWWIDHIHPDDRQRVVADTFEMLADSGAVRTAEYRYRRGDGSYAHVHDRCTVLRSPDLHALRLIGSLSDVSAHRRASSQLNLHALLLESVGDAIIASDAAGGITYWNPSAERLLGWRAVETLGRPLTDFIGSRAPCLSEAARFHAWQGECVVNVKGDGERDVFLTAAPVYDDEQASGTVYTMVDLSEHRRAAEEREQLLRILHEKQRSLDAIVHNVPFGVLLVEVPSGRLLLNNERLEQIFGRPYDGLDETGADEPTTLVRRDGSLIIERERPFVRAIRHGEPVYDEVYRYGRGDGTFCWVRVDAVPMRGEQGDVTAALITAQDVTAQVETELALHRSEADLRQSQKMEAVGRLAGGVAHDFNNLLGVIMSYSAMLLEELPPSDPIRPDIAEIQGAVDRAADLTRQLLAFSRQQVMQPEVIDLRDVVRSSERMLRRLIGEDITLLTALGEAPLRVLADSGQLEQVVMNLVLNARDAMPTGGTLRMVTRAVHLDSETSARGDEPAVPAGSYALISVIDTGHGMDSETKARIFDPFFTTKDIGKGTGLGLATVYGIVRQTGGHVTVETQPGMGTSFHILLPISEVAEGSDQADATSRLQPAESSGTILLVEDEAALRRITERILTREGFRVLAAANGGDALARLDGEPAIDCVVTDVVMPDMSGQQLLERVEARIGTTPAVLVSGYSIEAVERHGVLRPGKQLLTKPVRPAVLVEAVQAAIATRAAKRT